MISMGVLLAGSRANVYVDNPYFLMKLSTLLLIFVHFLIFRRSVYRDEIIPAVNGPSSSKAAKTAGAISLALWITVVIMGRWIAYYDRPDEANLPTESIHPFVTAIANR
jgi:hypothetical protein